MPRVTLAVAAVVTLASCIALPARAAALPSRATAPVTRAAGIPAHRDATRLSPAAEAMRAADQAASSAARAAGKPQIVARETTETSQTTAYPDGTFRVTENVMPVRVRQAGRWVPVSAALKRNLNGRWQPAAAPSGLTLSGGGTGPLAVLTSLAGGRLILPAPARMPAPIVSGATASYRNIVPGITIELSADTLGGLTETVTIASKTAAASPLARRLTLGVTGQGVAVTADAHGNLIAAAGALDEFTSSPPLAASALPSAASRRGILLARPDMGLRPAMNGRQVLATLASALPSAATYPLTLSQSFNPDIVSTAPAASPIRPTAAGARPDAMAPATSTNCTSNTGEPPLCSDNPAFDETQGGSCATNTNYNQAQPVAANRVTGASGTIVGNGIGYMDYGDDGCNPSDYEAYYEFTLGGLSTNMVVIGASLFVTETGGADENSSCNDQWPVTLWWTDVIGPNTDGANPPKVDNGGNSVGPAQEVDNGPNPNSTCTNVNFHFPVTGMMQDAVSGSSPWATWTVGMTGDQQALGHATCAGGYAEQAGSNNCGFMRLGDNPSINIYYDLFPDKPTNVTNGGVACVTTGIGPWLNATSANLTADVKPAIDGEPIAAYFDLLDEDTAAETELSTAYETAPAGQSADFSHNWTGLVSGEEYDWFVLGEVDGITGHADGSTGPLYSAEGGPCFFAVDTTPPVLTSVSSTAFPRDGGGQYAGTTGSFTLTGHDQVPTNDNNCDGSTCVASGIAKFEYSLNDSTIPDGGFTSNTQTQGSVAAAANSGGSVSATANIDVGDWGENILYVEAIDNAGNPSGGEYAYYFTVPWQPITAPGAIGGDLPGDVDGDTLPDLLATTATGALDLFPGTSTGVPSFPATPTIAGDFSPDGNSDWNNYDISHRGSNQAAQVDDLLALGNNNLYLFKNNPPSKGASPQYSTQFMSSVFKPACSTSYDTTNNCTNYIQNAWTTSNSSNPADIVSQILDVGPSATAPNSDNANLVSVEDGQLWFYTGQGGGSFGDPVLIGSSAGSGSSGTTNWSNMTLLAPGTEGTAGTIAIWARDNNTADSTYGDIYNYVITLDSNGVPSLGASGPVTATSGTLLEYATGSDAGQDVNLPASNYPEIATTGNANKPASIDVIDNLGNVWQYAGYQPSGSLTVSTPAELITSPPSASVATVPAGSIHQLS